MNHLLAREVINNGLAVINFCIALTIIAHLYGEWRTRGVRRGYHRLGNRAALAMLIYIVGETIIRAWAGVLLWHYAEGRNAIEVEAKYPVALFGAAIALVGAVCMMRIFSRASWGNRVWIGSVVLAAVVVVGWRMA